MTLIPGVSNAKIKRAQKMQRGPEGWGHDVIVGVLEGFGFDVKEGSEHTICSDPGDKLNAVQVPRHRHVRGYVAEDAVKAIERMLARKGLSLNGS